MKIRFLLPKSFSCFALAALLLLTGLSSVNAQFHCVTSGSPIVTSGSIVVADATQTGRIVRDGRPSTCTGKTNLLQNATVIHADSYNFTNPTGTQACVTVEFNHTGCGVNSTQVNAYSTYNPATPQTGVIGDSGFSSTGLGSFAFSVAAGASYTIVVHEITANTGCAAYTFNVSYSTTCRQIGLDRTNDGKADPTVFRPLADAFWHSLSSAGGVVSNQFGKDTDTLAAADYTGDGSTDLGVFRSSTGTWYNSLNPAINYGATFWGLPTDIAVPGDYDKDGKEDIAVWRPSNGTWYVLRSSTGTLLAQQWGQPGDIPVVGDFDGDRVTDFGLVRPNDPAAPGQNVWYVLESNFAFGFFLRTSWGQSGDRIVPADYDGDGKTDIAVFRPSEGRWYIIRSSIVTGTASTNIDWGLAGDVPQPADYDGDKIADAAVVRGSNWYVRRSSDSTLQTFNWGIAGDVAATTPYTIRNIP